MVIVGLTGSIGMGKTVAAGMFRRLGVPVHDSDATVHGLLGPDGAGVAPVGRAFPEARAGNAIDRAGLARRVFGDPGALGRLEAILHPLVRADQFAFLARAARRRAAVAVLDVPLLFETGGDAACDLVAVVHTRRCVQEARLRARPGMTPERLAAIRARQMPDADKLRRADFVIPSGLGRRHALHAVRHAVKVARASWGRKWPWPPLHTTNEAGADHA